MCAPKAKLRQEDPGVTCDHQEISRVEPGAHRKAIRHKAAPSSIPPVGTIYWTKFWASCPPSWMQFVKSLLSSVKSLANCTTNLGATNELWWSHEIYESMTWTRQSLETVRDRSSLPASAAQASTSVLEMLKINDQRSPQQTRYAHHRYKMAQRFLPC